MGIWRFQVNHESRWCRPWVNHYGQCFELIIATVLRECPIWVAGRIGIVSNAQIITGTTATVAPRVVGKQRFT